MESQVRKMKQVLEKRYVIKVLEHHHLSPWMIAYAALVGGQPGKREMKLIINGNSWSLGNASGI